jgi:glycerophosphoryl diester phosphodiesterase
VTISLQSVFAAVLSGTLGIGIIAASQAQNVSTAIAPTMSGGLPLVIGHRGASGHRPEHTIASYELAIEYGADFIEPDLVSTKDGALISRHENEISGTSDVAQKFPERRTTKTVYEIPTFQEVIDLAKRKSQEKDRLIGIYPETKHPSYFRSIGLMLEPPLVKTLLASGYADAGAPVFIQSFEVQNLKELSKLTKIRLVQLMEANKLQPYDFIVAGDRRTYGDLMTPTALAELATYATGIGPSKRSIVPQGSDRALLTPTNLMADAHRAGLLVHPYTFRDEPDFLAPDYRLDPIKEYLQFYMLGVDGVFSDFSDTAVRARALLRP